MAKEKTIGAHLLYMSLYLIPFGMASVAAFSFGNCSDAKESAYIVTDKGANKIAYYSIQNPADSHVMMFEDTVSFYPYINIGDTITGVQRHIDRKVASSQYTTNHGTHQVISAVNGHGLPELREIARRDSMLRTMRQNQK